MKLNCKDYNKKNTDELLEIAEAIGIDILEKPKGSNH